VLAIAIFALYYRHLAGAWRGIYVVSAVLALYLNVFVAVVQSFLKVPMLNSLAPTQAEPPFIVAQSAVLLIFIALGILAFRSFHPRTDGPALASAELDQLEGEHGYEQGLNCTPQGSARDAHGLGAEARRDIAER